MSVIAPVLEQLAAEIGGLGAELGRRADVRRLGITSREGLLPLEPPDVRSSNGSCRLFRAKDGWMALNLARQEDLALVPAWLECEFDEDSWRLLETAGPERQRSALVERAALLGLPAAAVGEAVGGSLQPPVITFGKPRPYVPRPLKVVDLSALWAGPMCGAILAAAGASVVRIEDRRRPDPTRTLTPEFFHRLNGRKELLSLDFAAMDDRRVLRESVEAADLLITSARPRAFAPLGLDPTDVFENHPSLVWVAVTAYGWEGRGATRVGFGDDTAAAGGLVTWTTRGEPRFCGDALADPVTGLAATAAALRALLAGGGVLVDAAMARCAAGAAALCGLERQT